MNIINIKICILISIQFLMIFGKEAKPSAGDTIPKVLTEKDYARLFQTRRKESKQLVDIIKKEDKYERQYKLVEAAFEKLLKILQDAKTILISVQYDPMADKFPSHNARLVDAIFVKLENVCLFGEIILHAPDISYRILESRQNKNTDPEVPHWKDLLNWGIKYARYFNERIIDTKSQQLLWLVEQEINPERRTANFVNPYRIATEKQAHKKEKKPKTVKKGPKIVGRDEF